VSLGINCVPLLLYALANHSQSNMRDGAGWRDRRVAVETIIICPAMREHAGSLNTCKKFCGRALSNGDVGERMS
jgi:hypothetical protein